MFFRNKNQFGIALLCLIGVTFLAIQSRNQLRSSDLGTRRYVKVEFDLDRLLNPPARSFKRGGSGNSGADKCIEKSELSELFKQRSERVRSLCEKLHLNDKEERLERFHASVTVNRMERVYMCVVPKAGISSWNMVMLQLSGFLEPSKLEDYRLHMYSQNQSMERNMTLIGEKMFPHTHKFRFDETNGEKLHVMKEHSGVPFVGWTQTRHPLERLLSCYRDKVIERPLFTDHMMELRPAGWQNHTQFYQDPPSFSEFVDYVINELTIGTNPDSHYRPHFDLCRPCAMNYEYYLHYENVAEEANHVLSSLKLCGKFKLPKGEDPKKKVLQGPSTVELMQKYYGELTLNQLTTLYKIYRNDFLLMGYSDLADE